MNKFWVIINNAKPDSWSISIWSDLDKLATILPSNNKLHNKLLKNLHKLHFGNKTNKYFWIPFKGIWDSVSSINFDCINKKDKNYFIFQSSIKISPRMLKKLKDSYNAVIILYLPDTIKNLGIASSVQAFKRYCEYYLVDDVYSFDRSDCEKYNLKFFDVYSFNNKKQFSNEGNNEPSLFYIGNCRSEKRKRQLIGIFEHLRGKLLCDFNLNGVDDKDLLYQKEICYNHPMTYSEVVKECHKNSAILELLNTNQSGNTLRFKEAVCMNKKLVTNNPSVMESKYYNPDYILIFKNPLEIDPEWIKKEVKVNYHYNGEFSPIELIKMILDCHSKCKLN